MVLVDNEAEDTDYKSYIWTKIIKAAGDGTNADRGALPNGRGPIEFNDIIPTGAIASRIIPRFVTNLSSPLENEIVNLMTNGLNFGLRYDQIESAWKIISAANLNTLSEFSLGKAGDTTSSSLDASWIMSFVKEGSTYIITIRGLDYIFGSRSQNRFYLDTNQKTFDSTTGKTIKDKVVVLSINTDSTGITSLKRDIDLEVSDTIRYDDGYQAPDQIKIKFSDNDDDGVIDDPDSFEAIAGENSDNFLFFKEVVDESGNQVFQFIDTTEESILVRSNEANENPDDYDVGQLVYFSSSSENVVKRVVSTSSNSRIWQVEPSYIGVVGVDHLKFQYIHNANVDRRIDPSASNIIDVYLLTRSYDTDFRNYLAGAVSKPEPPSSESLRISFGSNLNAIKSISDEIIYHPVNYKVLFGSTADTKFQAIFKVVKNDVRSVNDNDLKVRIISAINEFFDVNNWDFGDRFYLGELITYITNTVAPDVSNLVILPKQSTQVFGSLFEIQSRSDEIFVSGATVDDIEIVSSINAVELRASPNAIVNNTN
jgi:hypothetical protein